MLTVVTNEVSVAVAGSGIPHAELAGAFDGSAAWVLAVVLAVFLLGWLTAAVAIGTGVIRSRVAPAWAGWALIAAPVVSVAANLGGVKALDVAGAALALVGLRRPRAGRRAWGGRSCEDGRDDVSSAPWRRPSSHVISARRWRPDARIPGRSRWPAAPT